MSDSLLARNVPSCDVNFINRYLIPNFCFFLILITSCKDARLVAGFVDVTEKKPQCVIQQLLNIVNKKGNPLVTKSR